MLRTYHASTVMINATWQAILKSALAKLRKFARRADFDASLKQVFGVEIESTELKQALTGGAGNDILTGDAGIDQFIYRSDRAYSISDIGSDILFDFTTGTDKVVVSKTTFNALKSLVGNGFSQSSDFAVVGDDSLVNNQAAFIVYSGGSGNLFYNQNGITAGLGTGAAFANLFTMPTTLTAADFTVVA
jgi:Ca2+-binding RTX toxin-like protein